MVREQGRGCERLWHSPCWPHALTRQGKRAGSGVPAARSRGTGGLRKGGCKSHLLKPKKDPVRGSVGPCQPSSEPSTAAMQGSLLSPVGHRDNAPRTPGHTGAGVGPSSANFGTTMTSAWLCPALQDWKPALELGSGQQRGAEQLPHCQGVGNAAPSPPGSHTPGPTPAPWARRGQGHGEGQSEHRRTRQQRNYLRKSRVWDTRGRDAPWGPLSPSPVPPSTSSPSPCPAPWSQGHPQVKICHLALIPQDIQAEPPRAVGSSPVAGRGLLIAVVPGGCSCRGCCIFRHYCIN